MVNPAFPYIVQRDFREHSVTQIDSVITILRGRQDKFCLSQIPRVQVDGTGDVARRLFRDRFFPSIGLVFPIRQVCGIGKRLNRDHCLEEIRSHLLRVKTACLKWDWLGSLHDWPPVLLNSLGRPKRCFGKTSDDGTEPNHGFDKQRISQRGEPCSEGWCGKNNNSGKLRSIGTSMTDAVACGIGFQPVIVGKTGWKPLPPNSVPVLTIASSYLPYSLLHHNIMQHPWIADRTTAFDASGIRKVFDLAAKLKDPVNLSIGQPDFDVPDDVKRAAIEAMEGGKNSYSPTQGIGPLREALKAEVAKLYPHEDRDVFVCSGTSGGLMLSMLSMINPGDEVIYADPFFVMYPALLEMCGGVSVKVNTYPDFRLSPEKIEAAITDRTKMILLNSPANPTGVTATKADLQEIAELAANHNIALVSDEIYSRFMFDEPFVSPAQFNDQTVVIDGFSKSHAMTGWRVGYVHGPREIISTMLKLQQYSFVCAPQPAQWGALRALDVDLGDAIEEYRKKRDLICDGLTGHYEIVKPGGAFYVFPKSPIPSGTEFVEQAIEKGLLMIPGKIFSDHDSHFRISFAASDETLQKGIDILKELAR